MTEDFTPFWPPGVGDRYFELYVLLPVMSLALLFWVYSLVRKLKVYFTNGFKPSDDGIWMWRKGDEPDGEPVGPVANVLMDIVAIVALGTGVLALLGFLRAT